MEQKIFKTLCLFVCVADHHQCLWPRFSMNARPIRFCNNANNCTNKWYNSAIMAIIVTTQHSFGPPGVNASLRGVSTPRKLHTESSHADLQCVGPPKSSSNPGQTICNKRYNGRNNVYNSTSSLPQAAFHCFSAPLWWLKSSSNLDCP